MNVSIITEYPLVLARHWPTERRGHRIDVTWWARTPDSPPELAVLSNWAGSNAIPLWVVLTGVAYVKTDDSLFTTANPIDVTDHLGGAVWGSFEHDFARLHLATGAPEYRVTP